MRITYQLIKNCKKYPTTSLWFWKALSQIRRGQSQLDALLVTHAARGNANITFTFQEVVKSLKTAFTFQDANFLRKARLQNMWNFRELALSSGRSQLWDFHAIRHLRCSEYASWFLGQPFGFRLPTLRREIEDMNGSRRGPWHWTYDLSTDGRLTHQQCTKQNTGE